MLREEKAKLTKKKIFETAIKLINTKGYDNITISEICKDAGVAKGTFYVHYKAKEDIVKESYYSEMSDFVLSKYNELNVEGRKLSIKEKIEGFLVSEFVFASNIGHEMTCRAYVINLNGCILAESDHFEKRTFTKVLKELISDGIKKEEFKINRTEDEIFLFLESFIRGLMASWCFDNGRFNIVEVGRKYIKDILNTL